MLSSGLAGRNRFTVLTKYMSHESTLVTALIACYRPQYSTVQYTLHAWEDKSVTFKIKQGEGRALINSLFLDAGIPLFLLTKTLEMLPY